MRPEDYGAEQKENEIPLMFGSVVSRRWFEVQYEGFLKAPFRECMTYVPASDFGPKHYWESECWGIRGLNQLLGLGKVNFTQFLYMERAKDHHFKADCSCGYYSYFDEPLLTDLPVPRKSRDRLVSDRYFVGAITESFGRMVYGDLGLRAQKLRLKAFVLYPDRVTFKDFWNRAFKSRMDKVWLFYFFGYIALQLFMGISGRNGWISNVIAAVLVTIYLSVHVLIYLSMRKTNKYAPCVNRNKELMNLLKSKYPGIPVYQSWEEAEKDFPHTNREDLP